MMLRYLLLGQAMAVSILGNAQKKTFSYDARLKMTSEKDSARSYVKFKKSGEGYYASHYSLRDELVMEGYYTVIDSSLHVGREGVFTFYHINGNVSKQGAYKKDLRNGVWKSYTYSTGKVKAEENFKDDSLDGHSVYFNSATGLKSSEGEYVNGKKEGVWKLYSKGVLYEEEVCKHDKVKERVVYNAEGKVIKRLSYDNDKYVSGQAYDASGAEMPLVLTKHDSTIGIYTYVEQMPSRPYDLNEFLRKNMHYPDSARKKNITGKVKVKFVVDEKGRVGEVHVVESVSPDLDAEAVRVISMLPDFRPGKQNGEPVKVWFTLPINFALED